ncbi:MAG TPA: hypothetical protein PKN33_08230 [Phycisphaerae bacterium]|nr:hypothetical protein [Phycisphaerales bacterium]HNO78035.1 hypothetical protein [Phycisphaerae bacterium]
MAKSFYSQEEACEKLEMNPAQLKDLVQNGSLREFRDGGKVTYKADEVDKIAEATDSIDLAGSSLSGSLGDFDMLSTAELTLEDTSAHSKAGDDSMEIRFADDDDTVTDASAKSGPGPSSTGSGTLSLGAEESLGGASSDKMGSGDLILEPLEETGGSGLSLGGGSDADAISLDDTTVGDSKEDDKEGTVVTSVGVSVFDDDEVEADADPLAQTVVSSGTGALGIDGVGSGSGLLDLTRESDDTSLGAELLDEIYPDDGPGGEMGDATRAGLEAGIVDSDDSGTGFMPTVVEDAAVPAGQPVAVVSYTEYPPDAVSTGLTGMMFIGVLTMCLSGLAAAAAVKGVYPAILDTLAQNNWIVGAASLGTALVALGIGFMIGKKSG